MVHTGMLVCMTAHAEHYTMTLYEAPQEVHYSTVDEHTPFTLRRYATNGHDVSEVRRPRKFRPISLGEKSVRAELKDSYDEYVSGCHVHDGCNGSMCVTPNGVLMVPQSLVVSLGVFSNSFAKMSKRAYDQYEKDPNGVYVECMKREMLTKAGIMRKMGSALVEGSMRLVLSPCWEISPDEVAIPDSVMKTFKYVRFAKNADGSDSTVYEETELFEGDYVLLIRPPSLWYGNTQPKKVVKWNNASIGFHPFNCDAYHADFDGDEGHIYPIGNALSIEEASHWIRPKMHKMEEYLSPEPGLYHDEWIPSEIRNANMSKMPRTTMSMSEVLSNAPIAEGWTACGMKEPLMREFARRHTDRDLPSMFVDECIRGMYDIMLQQTTQGAIGYMTRIARLYGSCFKVMDGDRVLVSLKDTSVLVHTGVLGISEGLEYQGNGALRAIESITSAAQQDALDAHKAKPGAVSGNVVASKMDMIRTMFQGSTEDCFVILSINTNGTKWDAKWELHRDDVAYVVIHKMVLLNTPVNDILGTTDTETLGRIKKAGVDPVPIALRMCDAIFAYHRRSAMKCDILFLAYIMCYKCDESKEAPFTPMGMLERGMRWMSTLQASHFRNLRGATGVDSIEPKVHRATTLTEMITMFANVKCI